MYSYSVDTVECSCVRYSYYRMRSLTIQCVLSSYSVDTVEKSCIGDSSNYQLYLTDNTAVFLCVDAGLPRNTGTPTTKILVNR